MDPWKLLEILEAEGLDPERAEHLRAELAEGTRHTPLPDPEPPSPGEGLAPRSLYHWHDLAILQGLMPDPSPVTALRSLDELLERDKRREEDGFPPKIRVGRLIKPGRGGKDKVVVVPSTVEEKLVHDKAYAPEQREGQAGGTGEGEEGEVIGEQPVRPEPAPGAGGAGQGEGGPHEMESSAYDLGKVLTQKFQLPNLIDKGKKRAFSHYTYDLTDRHRGFGQVLDKKATLRRVLETNIHLGNVQAEEPVDPTRLLIAPSDRIYRILSREKDYQSQAMVFFVRDYSGSMSGKPTEVVAAQHVMIYAWLLYQYERQVECRFILHDTEAKEVPDFYTYYNSRVAGGTQVSSAYRLVNQTVEKEGLAKDYNIYVFHGTDGDDWDSSGSQAIPELVKMLGYANRVGITVVRPAPGDSGNSEMERYLKKSRLSEEKPRLLRVDTLPDSADEPRIIEGIRKLIS